MACVGIICEYNPFHRGHASQFAQIRQRLGADTTIVCLMSGSYVQRGEPAIFDRMTRAKAALLSGANLVLEMPVNACLSSAEGFAQGGVPLLSPICDYLCFGMESEDASGLLPTAQALLSPEFSQKLRQALQTGISFPAARAQALKEMGLQNSPVEKPNDILAVEYTKALLQQNSPMKMLPILRPGDYHAQGPDENNPSATALRILLAEGRSIQPYTTQEAFCLFQNAPVHTLLSGEKALLYRLRTMQDGEFEALPYGSEGLWRRLMHACREEGSLEEILEAVKTKRYTRTRLNRMVLCAYLGIDAAMLASPAPYCRILGFDDLGREALRKSKKEGLYRPLGWQENSSYSALEKRANMLYTLFCRDAAESPTQAERQRVYRVTG